MTTEQMKEKLSTILTEHRYLHSLGVTETAQEMARTFGVDEEKAKIAGLLHDCAKQIDHEEQLKMCDTLGVFLDDTKRINRSLIHAELGAKLAETEFGVTDTEILDAIKYHTLGRPNMTKLEKILYLADIIEPHRKMFDGLEKLRALCKEDLDQALFYGLSLTMEHVNRKGLLLHTQTIEAEAYIKNQLQKEANTMESMTSLDKAKKAVQALDAKKASDITLLKVSDLTVLSDYFVICSGTSSTQVRALADAVEEAFEKINLHPLSREGKDGLNWILLDYGDFIVHVFYQETRAFYNLEKLWDDAEKIDISSIVNE